jgi:hypothetical protein
VQLIGTRRDDISYLENLALAEAALTNPVAPTEQTKINSKEN